MEQDKNERKSATRFKFFCLCTKLKNIKKIKKMIGSISFDGTR